MGETVTKDEWIEQRVEGFLRVYGAVCETFGLYVDPYVGVTTADVDGELNEHLTEIRKSVEQRLARLRRDSGRESEEG